MGIEVNDKECLELLKLLPVDGELHLGLKGRDPAGAGSGRRAVGTQPQMLGPKTPPSAHCS